VSDPFIDIRDKRLSELDDEQKDRAAELWLRNNCGWEDQRLHPTLNSIFRVIDRLRDGPIDMVLHCPACGLQHIDEPSPYAEAEGFIGEWTNPPHRSHLCHGCGHIWRPADVPTNGVQAVDTKGKNDSPVTTPLRPMGTTELQAWGLLEDDPYTDRRNAENNGD
jgi:hypothetical protein